MVGKIQLKEGDICEEVVDAIVNAANNALQLGAGVAGAIARAGGPAIQAACDAHSKISVGDAAVTEAGKLQAKYVIHAASMEPGGEASEESIRSAIRKSYLLAEQQGCESLAVPAVGAGIGGFSMQRCAEILLEEARTHLEKTKVLKEIRFVLLGEPAYRIFEMVNDAAKVAEQMERLRRR